jgi:hypothetical protein
VFNIKKGDVEETSRRPTVADDQVAACRLLLLDQQEFDAIWSAQARRFQSMRNHDPASRPEGGTRPDANA